MSTLSEQDVSPDLLRVSRRTGLIVRSLDTKSLDDLFTEIEKYDADERSETLEYLKRALNDTRTSVGAEPAFADE